MKSRVITLPPCLSVESDLPVVPVDHTGVRQVTCAVYPRQIAGQAMDEAGVSSRLMSRALRCRYGVSGTASDVSVGAQEPTAAVAASDAKISIASASPIVRPLARWCGGRRNVRRLFAKARRAAL